METTKKNVGRPLARIYRDGQGCEVMPAGETLRRALSTIAHQAVQLPDRTLQVFAVGIPLYDEIQFLDAPRLECDAGWEPLLQRLLLADGYRVETIGLSHADWPQPDPGRLHRLDVVDPDFLACARQHERALIRYTAEQVDPVHLIAQIALAWPQYKIAVVTMPIEEGRRIRDRLRGYGIQAVAVNSRNQPAEVGQVAVCTPAGLAHPPVQVAWLGVVIVVNVLHILSKDGRLAVGHANRARLFGLLENGERPTPLERDFLTGLFGFREITIPRHGHRERMVQVLRYPIRGGFRLPSQPDVLMAKRLGLWQHAVRNRKVAQIASAFREKDIDKIQQLFAHPASSLFHAPRPGVIVLVESIEHALALSRRLPAWPILTGTEICLDGLPREQAQTIRPGCPLGEADPLYAIVTTAGIGALDLSSVGVLVRADGGVALPALPRQSLVEPTRDAASPLLLIDFQDRHHPLLRRWSRWRQAASTERGWFAPGVDPVQGRVDRFLASRSKGS